MKNNNDKNIYDMLNDIDIDLSEFDRVDFNDIEKMKIKKKIRESVGKKKKNSYKKYISVASVAVISVAVISLTPVGTYASKAISDLVFDIKSALRIDSQEDHYIKTINKSITKENITIRLNEAVLNNDELIVSLTTISDDKIPKDMRIWRDKGAKVYINEEEIYVGEKSSSDNISKTNIDEVIFFELDTDKYTGVIDVKVEFEDITIYEENKDEQLEKQKTIKGPFIFEFDFDTNKLNKDIKHVPINTVIDMGNGAGMRLDKYVYTPLSQKIYYTKNDLAKDKEEQIILKGTDDLGNEVEFDIYGETNGVGQLESTKTGTPIEKSAKYLTLTAYERVWIKEGKKTRIELKEIQKNIKIDLTKSM